MSLLRRVRTHAALVPLVAWALIPIRGGSLRRAIGKRLGLSLSRRLMHRFGGRWRIVGALGPVTYLALLGLPFIPCINLDWGLLGSDAESERYLQVLWQVVAAALGLSIAMIGFVFEAFMSAASRSIGGSLREFARTTRLQLALRVGFAALVVDGFVLLDLGHQAPRGWAAACAIGLSATTLGVALPFVFMQTLRGFEFEYLVALRRGRIERLVHRAMEQQLRGQVGGTLVHNARAQGVGQGAWLHGPQEPLTFKQTRVIRDVKLGPLRRLSKREQVGDEPATELIAALEERVAAGRAVLAFPAGTTPLWRLVARCTVRTRRFALGENPGSLLVEELEKLHEAAKAAIRDGRGGDWELISEVYASALLAMPKAAAKMSVAFTGAVASPGMFQLGPLDRIQRFLHHEILSAIEIGDRELALDVVYFPARIARDALELNAPGLVNAMLSLYPSLYAAAAGP